MSSDFKDPTDDSPTITLRDVVFAEECGSGGFSTISGFYHSRLGNIALKKLSTSRTQSEGNLQQRAAREEEIWCAVAEHPNVLPFFGVYEIAFELYFVCPFMKHGSLNRYLRRNPNADRQRFLAQVAGAIAYMHNRGIIHGDIKASNILISNDLNALICDFGLAKSVTMTSSLGLEAAGTTQFLSPEVLMDGEEKTFASDVWAFGMTIYETLSGKVPFYEDNDFKTIELIAMDQRPPTSPERSPTGLPYSHMWSVARSCWLKLPGRRPLMEEIARRLLIPHPETLESHRFQSYLQDLKKQRMVTYCERILASGPQDVRVWSCYITVLDLARQMPRMDAIGHTSTGSGRSKNLAREKAALNLLRRLEYDVKAIL